MARNFLSTMIGPGAEGLQEEAGSRQAYARMTGGSDEPVDALGERETAFIRARDSFYMASVTEGGWPYIQHRGGRPGFLRPMGMNRIAFADVRGNRQFLSTANLLHDDRVALFLMDYPARRRLKLIGHARIVEPEEDPALVARLAAGYEVPPERAFVIHVTGFDWNCPQHITPRFTEAEVAAAVAPLHDEIATLRAEVARLKGEEA